MGGRRELANRRFVESSPYRASLPLEQPYGDLRVDVSLDASLAHLDEAVRATLTGLKCLTPHNGVHSREKGALR